MNSLIFWTCCFRDNWRCRNESDPRWRAVLRRKVREAVNELRYLTNRPRKQFGPSHYGHGG